MELTVQLAARVPHLLRKAVHKAAITADCSLGEYVIRVLMTDPGVQRELAELERQDKQKSRGQKKK